MKDNAFTRIIIDAIQDKKGTAVCHIDMEAIPSAPATDFIICQGKTPTQTSAIADYIVEKARELGNRKPIHIDGMRNGQWIIVDYGDMMVHVFTPDFREFYNLEDLWSDGVIKMIPDIN